MLIRLIYAMLGATHTFSLMPYAMFFIRYAFCRYAAAAIVLLFSSPLPLIEIFAAIRHDIAATWRVISTLSLLMLIRYFRCIISHWLTAGFDAAAITPRFVLLLIFMPDATLSL